MIQKNCFSPATATPFVLALAILLAPVILAGTAAAAPDQDNFDAYLGDTIDLHGVSYQGSQVYLFMTGPGLPANGVTLTDTTQRADQGHFTIVDLASDQTWSMKWNTDRIHNQIDPGTYNVYVSTTPTDLSGLVSGYKVLKVYLKDPGPRNGVSIQAGTYTLNPEKHISTAQPTTPEATILTTPPTPVPTVPTTEMTTLPVPTQTKKSSMMPFLTLAAFAGSAVIAGKFRKDR